MDLTGIGVVSGAERGAVVEQEATVREIQSCDRNCQTLPEISAKRQIEGACGPIFCERGPRREETTKIDPPYKKSRADRRPLQGRDQANPHLYRPVRG